MRTIKRETGFNLAIDNGFVNSWKHRSTTIIMPVMNKNGKRRGGIDLCFPWFGQHPEKHLPKHGWLRNLTMNSVSFDPTLGECSWVRMELPCYPWKYQAETNVWQKGCTLGVSIKATRIDDRSDFAPVMPAFHPYFSAPDGVEIKFDDKLLLGLQGPIMAQLYEISRPGTIEIFLTGIGKVEMSLSPNFFEHSPHLVVWSDNTRYICVEPVMGDPKSYPYQALLMEPAGTLEVSMQLNFEPEK